MQVLGINLSDTSAEGVVAQSTIWQRPALKAYGRLHLPAGLIDHGRIVDVAALAKQLKQLWSVLQPATLAVNTIALSIPEHQVYSRVLSFPAQTTLEQARATLQKNLAHYVPFTADEVVFDCALLGRTTQQQEVLLTAVAKPILQAYRTLADYLKCRLVTLELESLSTARVVVPTLKSGQALGLLDLGETTSIVSLFDVYGLRLTYNTPVAGQSLTQALANNLKITLVEAEALKLQQGLNQSQASASQALKTTLEPLLTSMNEAMAYFQDQTGQTIQQWLCIGGTANLVGLFEYLGQQLHLPCIQAQLQGITIGRNLADLAKNELMYCNAIGLAIGAIAPKLRRQWINFITS